MKYEFLEHTADIKFKAYGKTLNKAFENAVLAIAEYLSRNQRIKSKKIKIIEIHGSDLKNLLYSFLDEIIYLFDAENFITSRAKIKILGNSIKAVLYGDSTENYKDLDHIKAPTYAEMHVKKIDKGWEIQAVVDV